MKSFLIACSLVTLSLPLHAAIEPMFSSQGGIQQRLVNDIDHAAQTIDVAMFDLTAEQIIQALKRAGERGVSVRMVLDAANRKEHGRDGELKDTPNLEIRSLGGRTHSRGLMHSKFAIIDGEKMETGSYNWTQGAEHSNYENALFIDTPEVIAAYKDEFSRLWDLAVKKGSRATHARSHKHASPHAPQT